MRNEVFGSVDHLSLPVPAGTAAGRPVKVGGLIGVTQTGEGEGGNAPGRATVWLTGAFDLEVQGAIASVGDPVYLTPAGGLSATASGNIFFGFALATKAAGAGVVTVIVSEAPWRRWATDLG